MSYISEKYNSPCNVNNFFLRQEALKICCNNEIKFNAKIYELIKRKCQVFFKKKLVFLKSINVNSEEFFLEKKQLNECVEENSA